MQSKADLISESIQNGVEEDAGLDDAMKDIEKAVLRDDALEEMEKRFSALQDKTENIDSAPVIDTRSRKVRRAERDANPQKRYRDRVARRSASPVAEVNSKAPTDVEKASDVLIATLVPSAPPMPQQQLPAPQIYVNVAPPVVLNQQQPPAQVNFIAPQPVPVVAPPPPPLAPPQPPKTPAFVNYNGKFHVQDTVVYVKDFVLPNLTLFEVCTDTFLRWTIYVKDKSTPQADASLLRHLNTQDTDRYTPRGVFHYLLPILSIDRNKLVDLINGMYNSTLECKIYTYLRDFLLESVVALSVGSMKGNTNLWLPAKIIDIMVQSNLQFLFNVEHHQITYCTILYVINFLSIRNSVLSMGLPINSVSVSVLSKAKEGMDF
jgi:hypothetical protein